uniref:Uncharacterized protein n=1 Tax=viral metagenome TaxID=1070528 RepID=A0A6C0I4N3_9ZZZZ
MSDFDTNGCAFNADKYVELYPDVKAKFDGNGPAIENHFITVGLAEGRTPCGNIDSTCKFDPLAYISINKDLQNSFNGDTAAITDHYKIHGIHQGRSICPSKTLSACPTMATSDKQLDDLLTKESDRLAKKKIDIDNALIGQQHEQIMIDSHAKRVGQYNKIMIAVFVGFIALIILYALSKIIIFIPSYVVDTLSLLIIMMTIIYCYVMYREVLIRDRVNYDEVKMNGPPLKERIPPRSAIDRNIIDPIFGNPTIGNVMIGNPTIGNLMIGNTMIGNPLALACIGGDCCDTLERTTVWDNLNGRCIPNPVLKCNGNAVVVVVKDHFTTLSNSRTEYDNYVKY